MKAIYRVTETKSSLYGGRTRTYKLEGTLEELIEAYSYTLEVGESWQHERGNRKINRHPKTIASLCNNLINATNNAAKNGYSGSFFTYERIK